MTSNRGTKGYGYTFLYHFFSLDKAFNEIYEFLFAAGPATLLKI